jgi:lipopolysaccharide/colanic/teichoic acid biosynthesis glycosyltransferase
VFDLYDHYNLTYRFKRPEYLAIRVLSLGFGIDICISFVGLILAFPVMLLTALAIKLDSRGPVLLSQKRVGHNNKFFELLKFRSMITDAETNGVIWAKEKDPRVTRIGKIILKTRIDEIPLGD